MKNMENHGRWKIVKLSLSLSCQSPAMQQLQFAKFHWLVTDLLPAFRAVNT